MTQLMTFGILEQEPTFNYYIYFTLTVSIDITRFKNTSCQDYFTLLRSILVLIALVKPLIDALTDMRLALFFLVVLSSGG